MQHEPIYFEGKQCGDLIWLDNEFAFHNIRNAIFGALKSDLCGKITGEQQLQ